MTSEITAENFSDTFNLDYAVSLADGLSNIEPESAAVSRLVEWCKERGHEVSRQVCADVLESQIRYLSERGIDE